MTSWSAGARAKEVVLARQFLFGELARVWGVATASAPRADLEAAVDELVKRVVPETMYTGPDLLLRHRPATGMIRRWRSA